MSDDPSNLSNVGGTAPARAAESGQHVVSVVGANIRRLRERAGLSLRELASRAAVSASTLSGLEGGVGNPGVETLVNVSGALGVPFSELVMPHAPDVQVQRAEEGIVVEAQGAPFTSRLLVAASGRSVTEVYEAAMEPGKLYTAEPHLPGVSESVIVVEGKLRVGPRDATVELRAGDRATFAADQVHTYEALGAHRARLVLVISYR